MHKHSVYRDDCLCLNCYKLHLAINEDIHPIASDGKLRSLLGTPCASHITNKVDGALLATFSTLAEHFLKQKAMLLPELSKVFLSAYFGNEAVPLDTIKIETEESSIKFTNQWLLHQLIIKFGTELCYKCIHPKLGTVLYRGADLLTCLSWALGKNNNMP